MVDWHREHAYELDEKRQVELGEQDSQLVGAPPMLGMKALEVEAVMRWTPD